MMFKKIILVSFTFLSGCAETTTSPEPLPEEPFLIIAHRGASAYAPDHTIASYQMAVDMEADYIEIDLHMTKDGKLVALHDEVVLAMDDKEMVSDFTFDELKFLSPGKVFNMKHPVFASQTFESSRIPELKEILTHFEGIANFYIELKSPANYPGIEKKLLQNLQSHGVLTNEGQLPKVIIQSFNEASLKKVFEMEPSIPLIQLYSFKKRATLSHREVLELKKYASGVGVNVDSLTQEFVRQMHSEGLHVHPFTVNDEESLQAIMKLGVDGVFTDKPDTAREVLLEMDFE